MKNFVLGIIATIVFVAIAAGAFYYGTRYSNPQTVPVPVPTPIVKPDISPEPTVFAAPTVTPVPSVKTESDNELIRNALHQKNGWPAGSVTVTVSTNDGTYASGTATAQGGGGYFFAAKVGGVWKIVADGNGVIECSSLTAYPNYPTTLIPECYDSATQKTVKR